MTKDYIEDECGAKFPLNYTFDGVNNFVFSTDVMFEDLQALCLGLVAKLEAAQHSVQLTGATCPTHNEPVSDLIHYECGCSTTRPRN